MKKLLIALIAVSLASPAFADRGYGHGHGWDRGGRNHGWGWRGDWIFPALIGGAIMYDLARPQPVYVEQPVPVYTPSYAPAYSPPNVATPPPVQNWYFCPAANAYYPYVSACPTGWQTVPANPPLGSAAGSGIPLPPSANTPQVISVVPSPDSSGTSSTQEPLPEDDEYSPDAGPDQ